MAKRDHDLTDEQWAALQEAWDGCAYCGATGVPMQKDTVLAISRGGRYTVDNVVPACRWIRLSSLQVSLIASYS